jgi:penicillin-binding protein 1A
MLESPLSRTLVARARVHSYLRRNAARQVMSDSSPIPLRPPRRAEVVGVPADDGVWSARPKVKKLRVALLLAGLGVLALISTLFGMMMAVAHELPSLEAKAQFHAAVNSTLYASDGHHQVARLTDNENRIIDTDSEISPYIKNAVIAVEDKRFYQHSGVDLRGMARAVWEDVSKQGATQGASTITEQFVKNALLAQKNRTVFEKLREAALAYHLEKRWSKQKILDQYLDTIYFGNGAYGVESAVRTYFGGPGRHYAPGEHIADQVSPDQAALLAGMIASPGAYDPIQNPVRARKRRDLVLRDMLQQNMITQQQYATATEQALPSASDISRPETDSENPYYSTWVTQQLVDHYGAGRVFGGGMKITTSIDPAFQQAAEEAIAGRLGGLGPSASLVAIDNRTGGVKAMVGGSNYMRRPFNLATNGHRQPGSAIKPFILAAALEAGISPDSEWTSAPLTLHTPDGPFVVHNFQNSYGGVVSLLDATTTSDNSVFAQVGLKVGTRRIAQIARQMGIRTPLSTNAAMLLGGLREGVTPLEMAYAYSTIANHGMRVSGTFAPEPMGPVAISRVEDGGHVDKNQIVTRRVLPRSVADTMQNMLSTVVTAGTGRAAQVGEFAAGKTGTTSNYGDAWFVGFTNRYTVAVWVGYPDSVRSMAHDYNGGPVEGGTYPAEIWHDFVSQAISIDQSRHQSSDQGSSSSSSSSSGASLPSPGPSVPVTPAAPPPVTHTAPAQTAPSAPAPRTAPSAPAPSQPAPAPPQPAPTPPPQQQPAPGPSAPSGAPGGGKGGASAPAG